MTRGSRLPTASLSNSDFMSSMERSSASGADGCWARALCPAPVPQDRAAAIRSAETRTGSGPWREDRPCFPVFPPAAASLRGSAGAMLPAALIKPLSGAVSEALQDFAGCPGPVDPEDFLDFLSPEVPGEPADLPDFRDFPAPECAQVVEAPADWPEFSGPEIPAVPADFPAIPEPAGIGKFPAPAGFMDFPVPADAWELQAPGRLSRLSRAVGQEAPSGPPMPAPPGSAWPQASARPAASAGDPPPE